MRPVSVQPGRRGPIEPAANRARSSRAWFSASIEEFRRTDAETILGHIAKYAEHDVVLTQRNTWLAQIEILRSALSELSGDIFFVYQAEPRFWILP